MSVLGVISWVLLAAILRVWRTNLESLRLSWRMVRVILRALGASLDGVGNYLGPNWQAKSGQVGFVR